MSVFINDSGVEKEAKMIYVNDGGVDKLVAGGGIEPSFSLGELFIYTGNSLPAGVRHLAYGKGLFVATGGSSTPGPFIKTSVDGLSWEDADWAGLTNPSGLAFDGNTFVWVYKRQYGSGIVRVSTDGVVWTQEASTFPSGSVTVEHISNVNGVWLAGGTHLLSSSDGKSWTQRLVGEFNSFAYGNGVYVAVGNGGKAATSTNGTSWTDRGVVIGSSSFSAFQVFFVSGLFLAVGYTTSGVGGARTYTSVDGVNWAFQHSFGTSRYYGAVLADSTVIIFLSSSATKYGDGISFSDGVLVGGATGLTVGNQLVFSYGNGILLGLYRLLDTTSGVVLGLSSNRWN